MLLHYTEAEGGGRAMIEAGITITPGYQTGRGSRGAGQEVLRLTARSTGYLERSYWIPGSWNLSMVYTDAIHAVCGMTLLCSRDGSGRRITARDKRQGGLRARPAWLAAT